MAQLSAVADSARRCARSANRSKCNGRGGSAGISHRRAWPFADGAGKRLDSMTAISNTNATATTARTVRPIRTSIHQFDPAAARRLRWSRRSYQPQRAANELNTELYNLAKIVQPPNVRAVDERGWKKA